LSFFAIDCLLIFFTSFKLLKGYEKRSIRRNNC
jgi:hypothetical protein